MKRAPVPSRSLPVLLFSVLLLTGGCASPARLEQSLDDLEVQSASAYKGSAQAQFLVGLMHEQGDGCAVDEHEAAVWYRLAAEQGHPAAQTNLGLLYYLGHGVQKSHAEAARWYALAADQGFAAAQGNLGVLYLLGLGVAPDSARARELLTLAARQGNRKAQRTLATVFYAGIGVEPDRVEAERWRRCSLQDAPDRSAGSRELGQAAFDSCLELIDRQLAAAQDSRL